MSIVVLNAGMLATVQDLGRPGWQHDGVPVGGAMDTVALRLANLLVGNDEGDAALEITLHGPTLRFEAATVVALGGADLDATIRDRALATWRPMPVAAGETLTFGTPRSGCRAYLAVAGGLYVTPVMGSRSTYLRARFGGLEGRQIRRGDRLSLVAPPRSYGASAHLESHAFTAPRRLAPDALPDYGEIVRLVAGPHLPMLTEDSRRELFAEPFRVSPQSDRMGYRLDGRTLALTEPVEPLSSGVTFGTVQLPPGGSPIVLMADRQTTGGYPRLGDVATVDLPALAQRRPGDSVRFAPIPVEEAQRLYLARERALAGVRRALAQSP